MASTGVSQDELQSKKRAENLRRILFLAFGGLLGLMVVAGLEALHSLRQLDGIERRVNQRYSTHNQALTTILISVHVYHDQMERYLLSGDNPESGTDAADVQNRGRKFATLCKGIPRMQGRKSRHCCLK